MSYRAEIAAVLNSVGVTLNGTEALERICDIVSKEKSRSYVAGQNDMDSRHKNADHDMGR